MTPAITIHRADITAAPASALITALNAELSARYPEPGATHFRLDPEEVAEGQGAFFIATLDGAPIACAALRRIDAHTAEIKRMYVAPTARGRGIGRLLLSALEAEARRMTMNRLVLETGLRQREALSLYERAGFMRIPPFGEYLDSPLSVCMEKPL